MTTCLTCLQSNGVEPISSTHKTLNLPLSEIITYCTTIEPSEALNYPTLICINCSSTLTLIYEFKRKALDNQTKLLQTSIVKSEELDITENIVKFEQPTEDAASASIDGVFVKHEPHSDQSDGEQAPARFACARCPETFRLRAQQRAHAALHAAVRHRCAQCDKSYTERSALGQHVRAVHEKRRPFACAVCDKAFARAAHLRLHVIVHTDERPFACDVCRKGFRFRHNRDRHMQTHDFAVE